MTDEDLLKNSEPPTEPIEEELPSEEELQGPEEPPQQEADPRVLNRVIPTVIAQVVFASSAVAADGSPPDPQQLAAQYVAMTSQILDLVDFQDCLGGMGELSKTTRLIIGIVSLVGGVFLMKPKSPKRPRKDSNERNDQPQPA